MDRYAVIGLGRFGYRLAVLLADAGAEVIAVDRDQEVVDDIRDSVSLAVCMSGTDERSLRAQGIDKVDVAVVGIGEDFEATVLTTVLLKQLQVPRVISRAITSRRGEILSRVGADALVNPERESAHRWCHRLLGPEVMEQIPLADRYSLAQIPVPSEWADKSLAELNVRAKYNVNVVAIRQSPSAADPTAEASTATDMMEVPMPHTKLAAGQILVLIGADEDIARLPR